MDTLVQTDEEIKSIILNEEPMKPGEEIFYSFGNGSFNYKLKSDFKNFDLYQMANSLIDIITGMGFDSLLKEHMQIFMLTCGKDPENTINDGVNTEAWLKRLRRNYFHMSAHQDSIGMGPERSSGRRRRTIQNG